MKKTTTAGGLIAILMLASYWLGANFGFGVGGGSGEGKYDEPVADVRSAPETATSSSPDPTPEPDPVMDGVLTVRLEGDRSLVQGKPMSPEAIAEFAAQRKARVIVLRADDATVAARESLETALSREQILYQVR